MQEIVILSIVAWWIAEGSNLIQRLKWRIKVNRIWYKEIEYKEYSPSHPDDKKRRFVRKKMLEERRLYPFDCPKCLGFWMGIGYVIFIGLNLHSLPIPILVSTGSIFISKIYERIKL